MSRLSLSVEAQDIIYACRDFTAPGAFNPTPSKTVSPHDIRKLIGCYPSRKAIQELIDAGLFRVVGENLYHVEEVAS